MKDIINSLDSKDTSIIAAGLQELIAQSYKIEDEYKALKRSYDELLRVMEGVIDRLPSAVWVLAASGVVAANSAARELNLDELLGCADTPSDHFEALIGSENYSIRREKFAENELVVATNITKEKRAERLQAMGQVATQLAHEIRNPLGSVMLMASALARRANSEQQGIISDMCEGIKRVEQIVANTLQFARGVRAKAESIDARQLQSECEELALLACGEEEISWTVEFENAQIMGDKGLLLQALGNLIYNAFEAAGAGGAVSIKGSVVRDETGCCGYLVQVHDSGELVAKPHKLFEAFYTTKLRGNGLGLAIARQIALACAGDLYYSDSPQKAFNLRLSLARS